MTVGVNSNFDLYDLAEFRFGIEILHSVVWDRKISDDGLGSKNCSKPPLPLLLLCVTRFLVQDSFFQAGLSCKMCFCEAGCLCLFSKIMSLVYACIGAVLFTVFLAIDTQMIVGGKRHEVSPEEHILGAILLYLDIIYIFLFILQIVGRSGD